MLLPHRCSSRKPNDDDGQEQERDDDENGRPKRGYLKAYTVFHAAQVEGIEFPEPETPPQTDRRPAASFVCVCVDSFTDALSLICASWRGLLAFSWASEDDDRTPRPGSPAGNQSKAPRYVHIED